MGDEYIKYFIGYKENTLSEEEKLTLINLINSDDNIKKEFLDFCVIWNISSDNIYTKKSNQFLVYEKILKKIQYDKKINKTRKIFLNIIKYAAVLILGFFLTIVFHTISNKNKAEKYLTFITKKGNKSFVILPDSSKVWLNSDSKIIFSLNFDNERIIKLSGEAYFEVVNIKNKPFKVITPYITIDVIGTKFNVKSYQEDKTVETTLIQGKIKIKDNKNSMYYYLEPNQKAIYKKYENKLFVQEIKFEDKTILFKDSIQKKKSLQINSEIAWKENILIFEDEPLEEIVKKLERWYGFEIFVEDKELLKYRYRGRFTNNETIYQVLEAIKFTTPIEYSVKENKIKINKIKKP